MALAIAAQFEQVLRTTRSALIVCRPNPSHDEIVASLAISAYVAQIGKTATVVSDHFSAPHALKFLPDIAQIKPHVGQLHDITITVPLGPDGLENIRHEIIDGAVVITVAPKSGVINTERIALHSSQFRFDLIIVVGAQDFSSLGATYSANTALFNSAPIVNVDCAASNEQFGHVNVVDITRTSVSEIVYELFIATHVSITAPTANLLLTGMIAATQSFKTRAVSAHTLQTASALIALGGDRELIVHHLYRQRSVAALKLWGAVLAHLQTDVQQPLMWSVLTREDFVRAGATESDLADLVGEIIHTAPNTKVFALVYETPENSHNIRVMIDAQKPYRADFLSSGFSKTIGTAEHAHSDLENYSLGDATTRVTNVLRAKMRG